MLGEERPGAPLAEPFACGTMLNADPKFPRKRKNAHPFFVETKKNADPKLCAYAQSPQNVLGSKTEASYKSAERRPKMLMVDDHHGERFQNTNFHIAISF